MRIASVDDDCVETAGLNATRRERAVFTVLHPDAQIFKNLSEHLKCFCIRAHYERLQRHTLRMLGPYRNEEQVTAVTSSEKGHQKGER